MGYRVYVTRKLPEAALSILRTAADVTVYPEEDEPVPRARLLADVAGTDAIVSLLTDRMDAEVMDAAGPNLKVIANVAVGYDNIDVAAAAARGITVTNTPGVLTETTADLAFALLLAAARRLTEAERYLRAGRWRTWSPMLLTGQDVYGATLGIVGMGRIGEAVAKRASGFDMRILYTSRSRHPEAETRYGCVYRPLDALLAEADFVVVLTPLTPETRGLIGRRELALMKQSAVLVNVARGPVVDETALVEALASRRIFAAGLDVYHQEPLPMDHPLLQLDNAVLLPHIGSASIRTRTRMAEMAAADVVAVLRGEEPAHPVVRGWRHAPQQP
ncbi:D-glycerate dehydrogenase [Alicyclobacillus cellulosilyticus]|uniref:D-glycerate dehydrogenase n=1 Tax=Alicyclobacillus cellulosilyticus TaxID=1003997 RepID=A0A917NG50_9BACL|nr:D-glycerate dehydrogenase [Alicyclobacillus cellulosilyticus]GGI98623.1 D-glycerate dehydrogenase [Alicyclobacillus cellulosilyticus]